MTTGNASQEAGQPMVGKRLRQAREAVGLSVAEVAAKQHLRPAVINAIEAGDYRSIDSELFLKGYVRAYATHVGIDPDSVVRQLDKELEPLREEQKARVEASPLVSIERRKRRKRQIAKIVAVLLVLAVLLYGGSLYLASREAPSDDLAEEVPAATGTTDQADVPPTDDSVVDDTESSDDSVAPEALAPEASEDPDAASPVEDGEPAGSPDETGQMNTPPSVGEVLAPPQTDDTVATEPEVGPEPSVTAGPVAESGESPAVPENNENRLVVEFSDDCWIEVQNSAGRTLVAELRRAGETLDVTGDGPLRVVLGAVSAVSTMSYGGDPVDLSDRRARNDRLVLNLSG